MLDIQVELSQSIFSKPKITITLPCWALQSPPPHAYHATDVDRCQLLSFGSAEKHACTHFQSTRQCIHYQQLVGTLFSWNIPISSSHCKPAFVRVCVSARVFFPPKWYFPLGTLSHGEFLSCGSSWACNAQLIFFFFFFACVCWCLCGCVWCLSVAIHMRRSLCIDVSIYVKNREYVCTWQCH